MRKHVEVSHDPRWVFSRYAVISTLEIDEKVMSFDAEFPGFLKNLPVKAYLTVISQNMSTI